MPTFRKYLGIFETQAFLTFRLQSLLILNRFENTKVFSKLRGAISRLLKPELRKCLRFENSWVFSKRRHFPSSGSKNTESLLIQFTISKTPGYFRNVGIFLVQDPKVLLACQFSLPFRKYLGIVETLAFSQFRVPKYCQPAHSIRRFENTWVFLET